MYHSLAYTRGGVETGNCRSKGRTSRAYMRSKRITKPVFPPVCMQPEVGNGRQLRSVVGASKQTHRNRMRLAVDVVRLCLPGGMTTS